MPMRFIWKFSNFYGELLATVPGKSNFSKKRALGLIVNLLTSPSLHLIPTGSIRCIASTTHLTINAKLQCYYLEKFLSTGQNLLYLGDMVFELLDGTHLLDLIKFPEWYKLTRGIKI